MLKRPSTPALLLLDGQSAGLKTQNRQQVGCNNLGRTAPQGKLSFGAGRLIVSVKLVLISDLGGSQLCAPAYYSSSISSCCHPPLPL
ncbi:hypothetical protein EYF80_000581 [Liparis tanakae]|uniref:Uncharacterized protein n=1 Tax=Liparis tanakae TaxID=230148 RepID=A0A4Z2JHL6_9TELE|nr:hypothetical protein EYF80_000581 [Liparis tanakae]